MAFDPALPQNNNPLSSAEMRGQLSSLKELIDELPASDAMIEAINAQSAGNTSGLAKLTAPISNPPTQAQVAAIQDKLNELIDLLNRA